MLEFVLNPKAFELFELEKLSFDYPWSISQIEEHLKLNRAWIIKFEENFLGHIIFQMSVEEIEIYKIAVLPQFQKKGFAGKILERLISEFGEREIFLEVSAENKTAIFFYLKHGFQKISIRKKYYPNGNDAIVMKKERNI